MIDEFDVIKITKYLEKHKDNLPTLYTWNANIDKLVEFGILTIEEKKYLDNLSRFEKEIELKKRINLELHKAYNHDSSYFNKLCLWIIRDWGGITTSNEADTLNLVKDFLNTKDKSFKRIASASKVGSYMFPKEFIIYDSRVAYSLNWIILSEKAGNKFFPIPEGRNSKMIAFDMDVLIRLANIEHYIPKDIEELNNRLFINNIDKSIYVPEKDSYKILNSLIQEINKKLWDGDAEYLYYTEMLLFSIADRNVYFDIVNKIKLSI